MGWFSDAISWVADDVLGFDPPKAGGSSAGAQPAVATTEPATNTPTPTPAQTSYDETRSYLQAQSQRAYLESLKQTIKTPVGEPPTFLQTEKGQQMLSFGIVAFVAWLFLSKGKF